MDGLSATLLGTSLLVGVMHTIVGVDHYVPFIALGAAERWSVRRSLLWTIGCGIGHIVSTLVLMLIAGAMGWAMGSLDALNTIRADVSAYLLVGFGLFITIIDLCRKGRSHHEHGDAWQRFVHPRSFWLVFIVFVLGPCESLIPLILVPALNHQMAVAGSVFVVFSLATLITMCSMVLMGRWLVHSFSDLASIRERSRALAGIAVSVSGVLVLWGL